MINSLYKIIEWAKVSGEVKVVDRMRIYVLAASLREGVQLASVTPETTCSPEYLQLVRNVASELVGQPCPY